MWCINMLLIHLVDGLKLPFRPFILRYIISFGIAMFFSHLSTQWLFYPFMNEAIAWHRRVTHFHLLIYTSVNTVILILQYLIIIREKNVAIEMENARLRMKNVEAANLQLKQQIHPHFLFNSLSTLKSLIRADADKAEEYLMRLSGLLRFTLATDAQNTITVAEELRLTNDYLDMQQIRFGDALRFAIDVPNEVMQQGTVPAFSIQLLAENAIKHNALTLSSPLTICIRYEQGYIWVRNNLQPKMDMEPSTGMGLSNLNERYRMISGDAVEAECSDKGFVVKIKVLDENSDH
jgi:LytS/YehU family sensor histidine kinase